MNTPTNPFDRTGHSKWPIPKCSLICMLDCSCVRVRRSVGRGGRHCLHRNERICYTVIHEYEWQFVSCQLKTNLSSAIFLLSFSCFFFFQKLGREWIVFYMSQCRNVALSPKRQGYGCGSSSSMSPWDSSWEPLAFVAWHAMASSSECIDGRWACDSNYISKYETSWEHIGPCVVCCAVIL